MKLSKEELQQLIDVYQTELRLLTYRSKLVSDELKELTRAERAAKPKRKPGRPATESTGKPGRPAKKSAGKRGRPAKKAAGKRGRPAKSGYRLNAWDDIVLKTLGSKKVGVFADFFGAAKKNSASKGLTQKDLYARINQSLHKLANKRGAIKKVEHEGRGFGYQVS